MTGGKVRATPVPLACWTGEIGLVAGFSRGAGKRPGSATEPVFIKYFSLLKGGFHEWGAAWPQWRRTRAISAQTKQEFGGASPISGERQETDEDFDRFD
jgi:hypothetical protein